MKNYPFYKKSYFLAALLPVICYGCFTAAERIFIAQNTNETQKTIDDLTLKMVESIAKLLGCDNLDAMSIVSAVDRGEVIEKKEAAAYELAAIECRQPSKNIVYEQFTFILNSRLDRDKFDPAAFERRYGVKFINEWTIDHTMAVAEEHAAIDAFIANEAGNVKLADHEEELSVGEPTAAAESEQTTTSPA
jgi:hypothetical protein